MNKITIAFDVDWTLIKNEPYWECNYIPNPRICHLLEILAWFKNIKIVVWSWWGKEHAKRAVKECNLQKFVKAYYSKNYKGKDPRGKHIFKPNFIPDIAIDDIQACELWLLNLIVREK